MTNTETFIALEMLGFWVCLKVAAEQVEIVRQFNRLTGRNLLDEKPKTPFEIAIDKATGYTYAGSQKEREDFQAFADFVRDCIWNRLPPETRANLVRRGAELFAE